MQNARKAAGLAVEDRIALTLGGDAELLDAVREHEDLVAGETLATSVRLDGEGGDAELATIEGRELRIAVKAVPRPSARRRAPTRCAAWAARRRSAGRAGRS